MTLTVSVVLIFNKSVGYTDVCYTVFLLFKIPEIIINNNNNDGDVLVCHFSVL